MRYNYFLVVATFILLNTNKIAADGAGILPYSHDQFGNTYFYVSREARGTAADTWSDFGGSFEPKDKLFNVVAAREFSEESINSFKDLNDNIIDEQRALNIINNNIGIFKLTNQFKTMAYGQFFIPVKNQINLYQRFDKNYNRALNELKFGKNINKKLLLAQTEKDIIASVKAEDLINSIMTNNRQIKIKYSSNQQLVPIDTKITLRGPFFSSLKLAYQKGILNQIINEAAQIKQPKIPQITQQTAQSATALVGLITKLRNLTNNLKGLQNK